MSLRDKTRQSALFSLLCASKAASSALTDEKYPRKPYVAFQVGLTILFPNKNIIFIFAKRRDAKALLLRKQY